MQKPLKPENTKKGEKIAKSPPGSDPKSRTKMLKRYENGNFQSIFVFLGLPRKQKIGVKKKGVEKVKLERNVDDSGREFWARFFFLGGGGAETLEK